MYATRRSQKTAFIDRYMALLRPRSILELGCGHGLILQSLRDSDAIGVEIDDGQAGPIICCDGCSGRTPTSKVTAGIIASGS
jgi:hypothetical protein